MELSQPVKIFNCLKFQASRYTSNMTKANQVEGKHSNVCIALFVIDAMHQPNHSDPLTLPTSLNHQHLSFDCSASSSGFVS